jgi:6-phosphogluconolactonase (cycloisomerase 2 family)
MALSIRFRGRGLAGVAAGILVGILGFSGSWAWAEDESAGAVYSLTNAADGNQLAVFQRNAQGGLTLAGMVPTGGLGTGGGLGNQGALVFGRSDQTLYAVNAGSDSLTVFRLGRDGPEVIQVIGSGGRRPISLAVGRDVLYVLNAGGGAGDMDQISGFQIHGQGRLQPLPNSTRPLSAANTGPAQVGFSGDGDTLVVTEKATNLIDTYRVGRDGSATGPIVQPSSGMEPFGFAFNRRGYLIVSEAFGGAAGASAASSYRLDPDTGMIAVVSPSVPTNQTAACWVAVTHNGEFAFTSNTGSGTVTGYSVARQTGALSRLNADGITGVTGGAPVDSATIGNRFLYVLVGSAAGPQVVAFRINSDGSLVSLGAVGGLPNGAIGLAAQ